MPKRMEEITKKAKDDWKASGDTEKAVEIATFWWWVTQHRSSGPIRSETG
jgi:hypothetical protein